MPMPPHAEAGAPLSVIALPGAEAIADRLDGALGASRIGLQSRRFPDGERYLRVLDAVDGRELLVATALRDPDAQLPSLFFLADTLRELGASRVGLVAPYLPYMRQDARFHSGEAVTSRSIAAWVDAHFDGLVTVDPHLHRIKTLGELFRVPGVVASSAGAIAAWVRAHVPRPHIVGPDAESEPWATEVAQGAGCAYSMLKKTRLGDREVQINLPPLERARLHAGAGRRHHLECADDGGCGQRAARRRVRGQRLHRRARGVRRRCRAAPGAGWCRPGRQLQHAAARQQCDRRDAGARRRGHGAAAGLGRRVGARHRPSIRVMTGAAAPRKGA